MSASAEVGTLLVTALAAHDIRGQFAPDPEAPNVQIFTAAGGTEGEPGAWSATVRLVDDLIEAAPVAREQYTQTVCAYLLRIDHLTKGERRVQG